MVENKTWIGISVVLLISSLVAIGYNFTDQTYFCEERGIVMDCARFSESELRCYPSLTTNIGYKDCSAGWIKISEPVEIEKDLSKEVKVFANGENYICEVIDGRIQSYSRCNSETNKEAYLGELV